MCARGLVAYPNFCLYPIETASLKIYSMVVDWAGEREAEGWLIEIRTSLDYYILISALN